MLILVPMDMTPAISHSWSSDQTDASQQSEELGRYSGTTSRPITDLRVGVTSYRLRSPVVGWWLPGESEAGEFWVEGFSPRFVGSGVVIDAAFDDWRYQIHETFQDLYGKRAFEMSEAELSAWRLLEDLIDVVGYRNSTPLVLREVGWVSETRPEPRRITWSDGRREPVDLEKMPGPFAAYKPGQWFEAVVERDSVTGQLLRVVSVQRVPAMRPMSEDHLSEFLQSLPGTNELPDSDESWTEP